MKDASKAEHESDDWVAEDMELLGSKVGPDMFDKVGWVTKDMFQGGQAASHRAQKRKVDGKGDIKNKKNWDIAKDMKRTGMSTDWIAHDMEEAGRPDSHNHKFATEHWLNKLDNELTKQEKHRNNVKKDMEETGRRGSNSSIQADMERTGRATNPLEALQDFYHSVTNQLNEWTEKAFNLQEISKDMLETGKPSDNHRLAHDMETTGKQGSDHAHSLPAQNKELNGDLSKVQHESIIAKDMKREGQPDSVHHSRRVEYKRNSFVYDDMKMTGSSGGSVSEERIRQDMEAAGHPEGPYYKKIIHNGTAETHVNKQYREEVQAFNKMLHARPKAPAVAGPKMRNFPFKTIQETKVDDVTVSNCEKTSEKGVLRHLLKKVVHPRTPWKDL